MADLKNYKKYGGGDFMELQQGNNVVRILTPFEEYLNVYINDKKKTIDEGTRFIAYVLDRADGVVKPLTASYSVFKGVGELGEMDDWKYDEIPHYDVIINKSGEGKNTRYNVQGGKNEEPINSEQQEVLNKMKPVKEIADAMDKKAKQKRADFIAEHGAPQSEPPEDEPINPDDIPF